MEIFTDGSSFVQDGKRKTGYAVVTAEQVLEAKSLPRGNQWSVSGACAPDPSSRIKQRAADGPDNLCESTSADSKYPESAVVSSRQYIPVLGSLLCCIIEREMHYQRNLLRKVEHALKHVSIISVSVIIFLIKAGKLNLEPRMHPSAAFSRYV